MGFRKILQGNSSINVKGLCLTSSITPSSSYTTPAYLPAPRALIIACVASWFSPTPSSPTSVSGNGLTWDLIASKTNGINTGRLDIYRTMGASPLLDSFTANFASSRAGCGIRIIQLTGVDTSGNNGSGAIAQSNTSSSINATNPSVTLSALNNSGKNTVIAFLEDNRPANLKTLERNWTLDINVPNANDTASSRFLSCYALRTLDNTILITANGSAWAMIGIEIKSL